MTFIPVSVPAEICIETMPAGAVATWNGRRIAQLRIQGEDGRLRIAYTALPFADALFDHLEDAIVQARKDAEAKRLQALEAAAAREAEAAEVERVRLARAAFEE